METPAVPTVGPSGPRFSRHSRARMAELHVTREMVVAALRNPHIVMPGGPEHRNNATVFVAGPIRVVADTNSDTVITVHLRTTIPYLHGVHHLDNLPAQGGHRN